MNKRTIGTIVVLVIVGILLLKVLPAILSLTMNLFGLGVLILVGLVAIAVVQKLKNR